MPAGWLAVTGEASFEWTLPCSCKGQGVVAWMFVPSCKVMERILFFVSVNRFWCIWMRALVFEASALRIGPGFLCWVV